ncbi:hypothetical protein SIM91_44245 [Rhodococcus opacus]|uniref:hypothetical protein n=1 Tax=Rhodococcus opacus TaxID=37919 RepID=UPI00226405D8|nr:hypothetical protein [Rhodococcus opacus]MDX5970154.1 hypothetical protein [Rhodococcus opacus]
MGERRVASWTLVIYTVHLRRVDEGAVVEWFVSFWDLETQRTSVRAGEASNRVDAMTQVIATGRELARRDDGSVVNKTAHIRIGTELAVVAGFDNPHLSDENLRCRIEAAITAKQQHARTMQQRISVEL